MAFKVATKDKSRARVALIGPPGSGKTFSALRIARGLAGPNGRIGLLDTENKTASKYADQFHFEVDELDRFAPGNYVEKIHDANLEGIDVLIVDSLSHAWMGKGGALEQVDQAAARSKSGNSYVAWREVTPQHNALVEAIIRSPLHIIVTLRAKTDYIQEKDKDGKTVIRKVGLAPIQREGLEYEFDVVGEMDLDNNLVVTKSRCSALNRAVIKEPGEALGQTLADWLAGPSLEEVMTYVQTEADHCETVEHLSALRKLLEAKGGSWWTEAVKAVLKLTFDRVKPPSAPTNPAPQAATAPAPTAATSAAPLEESPKGEPGSFQHEAPESSAEQKVKRAIASVSLLLKECVTSEDYSRVRDDCKAEGGAYHDPRVVQTVNAAYRAAFPDEFLPNGGRKIDEGDRVRDRVKDIQSKTGPKREGGEYTRYTIETFANGFFTTFDGRLAALAADAKTADREVEIEYAPNGRWKDLRSLKMTSPETEAPAPNTAPILI